MSKDDSQSILNKKVFYSFLVIMAIMFVIGIITSFIRLSNGIDFGHDFRYYHAAVREFWSGNNPYDLDGSVYLNYFYVICFWMLLPEFISFPIHITITFIMFYFILKNIDTEYKEWWIYGNIIMVFWWAQLFNINMWITFGLFMYQKYRDKWYGPFFLLFVFSKMTAIIFFVILYIVNLFYEKEIKREPIPALLTVFGITGISYLTSTGMTSNVFNLDVISLFFQVPHYIWWTVPIYAFMEHKKTSIENVKKFWVIFCIFEIVLIIIAIPIIAQGLDTFIS